MVTATATRTPVASRTDEDIQRDVLAELKFEPRLKPNEISVIVRDGVVTLTGWVDSYLKRWTAEQAAHRVRGVKAVANDIDVRLPPSSERLDAEIAAAVRALEWDADVPADKIRVTVSKGWVTLTGQVEWHYQKEEAERAVRRLWGVRGVTNLITVEPSVTPQELKQKIERALVRSAKVDADRITVKMHGSTASLRGTVRSRAEREEAERAAWRPPGSPR